MTLPAFTMRQMIEAGVHFGHTTRRWNPKMKPYIFGVRDGVHIMDLQQTVPMMYRALEAVRDVAANGGKVLFVGTKRQGQEIIANAAQKCGQHYVNSTWMGGTLTNWRTISQSVKRLKTLEEKVEKGEAEGKDGLTKKERLTIQRQASKLDRALGGIKNLNGRPDIIFVQDVCKDHLAIAEANCLKIPVVAVCDSNANPDGVTYVIPGNDDAIKAITLYCDLISAAVLDGIQAELKAAGVKVESDLNDEKAGGQPTKEE